MNTRFQGVLQKRSVPLHRFFYREICEGLNFMFIFAMSLMILLVFKRSTKVSEKSDMTKSWADRQCRFARRRTFCCSGTYKDS